MATLLDPKKKPLLRREFIDIAKKLDPIDTGVLPLLETPQMQPSKIEAIASRLGVTQDEVANSFRNLAILELSEPRQIINYMGQPYLTALGRQFLRAVRG